MARIGLVAGGGRIPVLFLEEAKKKGDEVIAFGIKGVTDPGLERVADKMHWLSWGELKKATMLLMMERIKKIVLLGKIKKEAVFKDAGNFDEEAKKILDKVGDKKDYALLKTAADFLKKVGVEVIEPTVYLKGLIPSKGVLTQHGPSASEIEDVKYGIKIARELADMDIGQSIAVKDKTVIAVEAAEGTDEMISRAGKLVKDGFTVIKVARPEQDMRFDIPLVGPDTLHAMEKAGASVLALEACRTLLIDKEELVNFADSNDISVIII